MRKNTLTAKIDVSNNIAQERLWLSGNFVGADPRVCPFSFRQILF